MNNANPTNTCRNWGEIRCSGRENRSCYTSG